MFLATKTPMQALSVQSFHNDSPPFTGSTARSMLDPPPLDLDSPQSAPGSGSNSPHYSHSEALADNATPECGAPITGIPKDLVIPAVARAQHNSNLVGGRPPTPEHLRAKLRMAAPASPALNPEPTFSTMHCPDGNGSPPSQMRIVEPDAEASIIPRGGSPIDLQQEAKHYSFPRHRLVSKMQDESKIPLVIVACGSFSPPTYLHLRMFEMAKDSIDEGQKYEILGGYYSPVSDFYKKAGLAPAIHRVRMCELAVDQTSNWLMVDPWEASQPEYQRTAVVLEHFDEHLNGNGGISLSNGTKRKVKIVLLAGGDLIESFGEPGVWADQDLHIILGRFGCLIVERTGSDVWAFLLSHDILYRHRKNIIVVKQLIYNDISSTKVRLFVRRGMSIKYLLPNSVIQYIQDHELYRSSDAKPVEESKF